VLELTTGEAMSLIHITHWEPLWARKKVSRSEWRKSHDTLHKSRRPHGGRGKIYGLKSKKARRRSV